MTTVFYFGYGGHSWQAEQLREALTELNIKLVTCHEYPNADVKWDRYTFISELDKADIVICPVRSKMEPAKSVNRLAMAWSRGKACIVSPLPAYLKYVVPGVNALVANSKEEFLSHIEYLHAHAAHRIDMGKAGKDTANQYLHPRKLIHTFIKEIEGTQKHAAEPEVVQVLEAEVAQESAAQQIPKDVKLQIIIPHYTADLTYLKACVRSLVAADLPLNTDVLVVSSSAADPSIDIAQCVPLDGPVFRCLHSTTRLSFSQANNLGIKNAAEGVTHFLLLNDDTIVSKYSLPGMFRALGGKDNIMLNPYSNCDQGWLHTDKLVVKSDQDSPNKSTSLVLHPGMKMEQVDNIGSALHDYNPSQDYTLHGTPFCAMYATLIPNRVLRAVGLLNEAFLNGGEDADYSYRAHKLGFHTNWTRGGFVFHFGGRSRTVAQIEDPEKHIREDQFNNSLLRKRWPKGSASKRLGIWTGPAWESWNFDSLAAGIGGSEICALKLAETAVLNGWQVTMIGDHKPEWLGSIELLPWRSWNPESDFFDALVVSRNLNPIDWRIKAKKILVWVHDIYCLNGKTIAESVLQRVDHFLVLSPWHRDFWLSYHQVPEKYHHKVVVVPNGVSIELFT